MTHSFVVHGQPVPKPRMTRADRWRQRPCVLRYRAWADACRLAAGAVPAADQVSLLRVEVRFPMPASWSAKKRAAMAGQPHRQRGDIDNVIKAVMDSLWEQDGGIWRVKASKIWDDSQWVVAIWIES